MSLKNFYTMSPSDVQIGDVFAVTVTFHVMNITPDGKMLVQAYRCPYPPTTTGRDGVPQGMRLTEGVRKLAQILMPVLGHYMKEI